MKRRAAEVAADILLALVKAPRTLSEISIVVNGDSNHRAQILPYVDALHANGLVYICGENARGYAIYRFQSQPFQAPDVPLQHGKTVGKRGRPAKLVTVDGKTMTVTEAMQVTGLHRSTLHKRVKAGKALTPARKAANIGL